MIGISLLALSLLLSQASSQRPIQEITVPLVTSNPEKSPLVGTGQATAVCTTTDAGLECLSELKGSLTNATSKSILAFEAEIDLELGYSGGVRSFQHYDAFLSGQPLMPGSSTEANIGPSKEVLPWNKKPPVDINDLPQRESRAVVRVAYVQFADGSTLGRSEWGDSLPDQRKNLIAILGKLLAAYEKDPPDVFASTIDKELAASDPSSDAKLFLYALRDRLHQDGRDLTFQYLKELLRNAAKNQLGTPR